MLRYHQSPTSSLCLSLSLSTMLTQAWLAMAALIYYVLLMCSITVESVAEADKIVALPGQPQVNFQQFAGYIRVDEKQDRSLFYYFVEAETNPSSKPLVLWLNGGWYTLYFNHSKKKEEKKILGKF